MKSLQTDRQIMKEKFVSLLQDLFSKGTVKPALKGPLYNKSLSIKGSLIFNINE
jgi:hypothetical protein